MLLNTLNGKFSQGVDASSISPSPAVQVPTPFGIDPTPTVKYPQATRTAEVPSQLDGNVIADKPTDRFQHGDNHVNPNDVDKSFHRRDVEELPDWIDDESSGEDFPSSDASILSENLATDEGYDSEYDEESSTHLPRMDMDQPDTVLPDYSSADDVDGSTAQDDDQSVEDDQFQEGDQFLDDVQPLDDDQSLEDEQFPEEDQSLNNDQFHEENQEDGTDDEGFDSGDEEDSLTSEEEEADEQPATSLPTIITELVNKYVYGGDNNVDEFSEEQATSFPTRITEMFSEYLNLGRKTDSSNAGKEDLGQEEETIPFPTRVANLVNKYLKSGVETEDRPTRVTEIMNSLYRGRNKPDSSNNDHKRAPATAFPTRVKELLNEYLYSGGNRGKSLDGENQGTVREEQATAFPTRVTELFNKYLYTGRDDSLDAGGEEQTTMFPTRVTEVVNKFFYPGESPTQATKGYAFPTIVTKLYNNVHKFFKGFSRDLSQVKNSEVNPKFRHRLQKRDLDISQGIPGEELHSATLSSEEQWKHAKKGESIRPSDEQLPSIGGGLDPSFGSSHHEFRRSLMGDDLGERRSGSSLTGSEGGIDELHSSVSTVEDTIREAPIGTSDARGYAGKHMEAKPHKKYDRIINGKKKRFGLLPTEENFIFNEDGSVTPKPGYSLGKKGYVGDISKLPGMDSDEHFQIDVDDDEPDELDEYIPGHISPSSEEQWKRAKKGESIRPSDEQLPSIGGGLDPSFGSSHREFRRSLNMDDLSEGRAGSSRTGSEGVMDDLDSTMSNVENNIREAPLGTSEARGNAGKHIEAKPHKKYDRIINGKKKRFGLLPTEENFIFNEDGSVTPKPGYSLGEKGYVGDISKLPGMDSDEHFQIDVDDEELEELDEQLYEGIRSYTDPGAYSGTSPKMSSEEQWKRAKKGESIRPSDEQLPSIGGGLDPSFGSSHHEFRRSLNMDDLSEGRAGSSRTGSEGVMDDLDSTMSNVENNIKEAPLGTSESTARGGKKYDRIINGKKKRFGLLPTEENFIFNEDGSVTPKPGYSLGKKGYVGDISKLPGMDSDEHFQIDVDDDEPDELDEYIPGHISPSSDEQWKRAKKGESIRPSDEQLPSIGGGLDPSFGSSHHEFRRSLSSDNLSERRAGSSRTGSEGVIDDPDSTMSTVENNIKEAPSVTARSTARGGKNYDRIINGKKKRFGLLPTEENFIFNEDGSVTPKPGYSLGKKGYVGDISKLPGMDSDEHFQIDIDDDELDELEDRSEGRAGSSRTGSEGVINDLESTMSNVENNIREAPLGTSDARSNAGKHMEGEII
ncbi:uncharacterized protein LOC116610250 isoform X2 [Nematostella vectensis]|uniref:uncharacterized protein LOC116610250 isoform X2 n=1 Tax=Nematostella vectensis TaxID=45351 RepID=UPI0020776E9C|nr:uncharacterized protein LOC116610250 isoform X2 [Nematostella vectensis]